MTVIDEAVPVIRAVEPSDEAAIDALLRGLDPESRYRRWFSYAVDVRRASRAAAHPELDHALGVLAVVGDEVIGHGVLIPVSAAAGEVAFEVAAEWRRHGVACRLLEALLSRAAAGGFEELRADVLAANRDMLAVFREHGEHTERRAGGVISFRIPVATDPLIS